MTAFQNEPSKCHELHRPTQVLSGAELDAVNGGFSLMSTLYASASRKYGEMLQTIARNIR